MQLTSFIAEAAPHHHRYLDLISLQKFAQAQLVVELVQVELPHRHRCLGPMRLHMMVLLLGRQGGALGLALLEDYFAEENRLGVVMRRLRALDQRMEGVEQQRELGLLLQGVVVALLEHLRGQPVVTQGLQPL